MREQIKKNIPVWEFAFDEINHLEHTSRFFIVKNHFYRSFFGCGPFFKSLLNLLQCYLCFMFWFFGLKACRILSPQPGIEPETLHWNAKS